MTLPVVPIESLTLDLFNYVIIRDCKRNAAKTGRTQWIAVWPTRPASDHSRRRPDQKDPWTPMFVSEDRAECEAHVGEISKTPAVGLIEITP